VLRHRESPRELIDAVQALAPRSSLSAAPAAGEAGGEGRVRGDQVLRTYGIGAQILKDLDVRRMRVLSAPKHMHGISAFDLEITGYVDH